jgi:hypothetical protein
MITKIKEVEDWHPLQSDMVSASGRAPQNGSDTPE